MVERINNAPEREQNPEELKETREKIGADIERNRNRALEKSPEKNVDKLREDAERQAELNKEKVETAPAEKQKAPVVRSRKAQQKRNYEMNMAEARSHMKGPSKAFSKVIHNPVVEKTSEVVGSTVARPNAVLAGSVTAFLVTLALYLIARHYGYPLSGFETIGAFALGWVLGIMFDYLRVMITGKRA